MGSLCAAHSVRRPWATVFTRFSGLLSELLQRCDKMATGLPFARVDYLLASAVPQNAKTPWRLYLGEVTLYPGGGRFRWEPASFDWELGEAYQQSQTGCP